MKILLGSRGNFTLSRCSIFAQGYGRTSKIHGDLQSSSLKQQPSRSSTFCNFDNVGHGVYF